MKIIKHEEYLNDPRLIKDLVAKLPSNLHQQWIKYVLEEKALGREDLLYRI